MIACLFSAAVAGAESQECSKERDLARLGDQQIIETVRPAGIGKCKMGLVSNGTTTWIQITGVTEFVSPDVGRYFVQEKFPTGNSAAYDLAMQRLMLRFRQKLVDCQCARD